MIYLLNTPVLTAYGDYRFSGPITPEQARARISSGFVSAIGHPAAAEFLSRLLDRDIPCQRITVILQPGDESLVLRLKERLPEARALSTQEMAEFPFELGWIDRLA